MKTAIYGGSFNPPHLGHVSAAQTVASTLKPDRFLIIPDNIPPHKQLAEGSPSPEARLDMCRLAFSCIEGAEISDIEINRSGRSYTADTIAALRQIYPDDRFFLVVGSDMLLSFTTGWRNFEYILSEATLTVLSREEGDAELLLQAAESLRHDYGANVVLLPHKALPMSSSDIRALLSEGGGQDYLSPEVYAYIFKNGLYI